MIARRKLLNLALTAGVSGLASGAQAAPNTTSDLPPGVRLEPVA